MMTIRDNCIDTDRTALILVTEDVKNAVEKAKLTNVRFQRITEMERFQP